MFNDAERFSRSYRSKLIIMDVIYSIGAKLGHGIGMTSYHAIEQIKKVGYLKKAITLDDIPIQSNDSITKDNTFEDRKSVV